MLSRRTFGSLIGAAACVGGAAASSASAQTLDLDAISLAAHEAAMRLAIAAAKANPFYPFGAVIIGAADRATLAQGVNDGKTNPIFHGEIAAINDYVARHGNQGWADGIWHSEASLARLLHFPDRRDPRVLQTGPLLPLPDQRRARQPRLPKRGSAQAKILCSRRSPHPLSARGRRA